MRDEKKLLLEEIEEKIGTAKSLVITKYENINAKESWDFRVALSKNSSDMEVVKKRILLKAFEKKGFKCTLQELDGHIAVIFINDDPMDAIKAIFEFSKRTDKLEVIKGTIDNKSYNKEDLLILSQLPSMDELRAQFLSLLEAPSQGVVSVMNSLLTSVVYALEEKKKLEEKK